MLAAVALPRTMISAPVVEVPHKSAHAPALVVAAVRKKSAALDWGRERIAVALQVEQHRKAVPGPSAWVALENSVVKKLEAVLGGRPGRPLPAVAPTRRRYCTPLVAEPKNY